MLIKSAALQTAALVFTLAFTANADIDYNVSRTVGTGSVTGTIETDGTITGPLTAANIVDWNLTISIPAVGSYNLKGPSSGNNSVVFVSGADVTATANDLYFNFSGADAGLLLFQTGLFSGNTYYCDGAPSNFACLQGESVVPTSVFSTYQNDPITGNVIIGTAGGTVSTAPEPTFMTLTGLGFAGLGFVAYRRRRTIS